MLTQDSFPLIWALGEPLVVEGLLNNFRVQWTPEYFVANHGAQACVIVDYEMEMKRRTTVGEFFREFGRYEGRTESYKLKHWPSMDFKKAFPELYKDFRNAVPSYVRRDGVLNIASHFPTDTVAPDLGKSLVLGPCSPHYPRRGPLIHLHRATNVQRDGSRDITAAHGHD
ncbi:hypothetical protein H0H81_003418 [Sphagnurus paluster]|uniref:Uncharacterized protein n=1 Tax=Sphagnurus paluster TaxID=117069 RepID=A0A9P7FN81_9AGAR|nr:hypothetical protein H0H81_003418 [Sphagnurus paluster]